MGMRAAVFPSVLAIMAGAAFGQVPAEPDEDEGHESLRSDPPAPYRRPVYAAPFGVMDGPFPLHQVNVGPGGLNILGDAANEPSIVVDPTAPNRIAIAWRQFDSVTSNFRQAGHAYSKDGGRTWVFPGSLDAGVFRSDPVLRSDSAGRIFLWSLTNATGNYTCQIFRSSDGGQTWGPLVQAFGGDKQWFDIDRTGGAGDGNFYGAWDYATAYTANGFTRSTDHGATYMNPIAMLGSPNWGTVAVGPNGEVYVVGNANQNLNTCIITKTVNANLPGVPTWSFSRTVPIGGSQVYYTQQPPNPEGLLGQFWVRVDTSTGPRRGWVYVLCSVHQTGSADPLDVMLTRSIDGGNTWSTTVKVNDEPPGANAYQWFGTLGISPDGRLDVVYNDTRNTGSVSRSEMRYTSSVDGGVTWAPSMAVTGQFDSTIGFPNQNKIGDYYDIQSDRTGCFVAMSATFNNEEDVYCIRIGGYDCNGNGVDDAVDIANGTAADCNANGIPDSCELAAGVPVICICYPNCDGSTVAPILNANDFQCFLNKFAAADPYANCDGSTVTPILNANDFQCFLNKFAAGCS